MGKLGGRPGKALGHKEAKAPGTTDTRGQGPVSPSSGPPQARPQGSRMGRTINGAPRRARTDWEVVRAGIEDH